MAQTLRAVIRGAEPLYTKFGDKVIALPHLGSISQEVYDSFAAVLFENITRARDGRPLLHVLTPPGSNVGVTEAS
jgi:phosphoglycerate dehydrogenase-like enzyme